MISTEPMNFDEMVDTFTWANGQVEPITLIMNSWQFQFVLVAMNERLKEDIKDKAIISPAGELIEQIRSKKEKV